MHIVKFYVVAAILCLLSAASLQHWYFSVLLAWLGVSLTVVSAAYLFDKPSIFRKRVDGSIPSYISWILFPFLLGAQLYNSWARRNDSVPPIQEIAPNLYLACRLFPSDVNYLKDIGVKGILDATSEFSGLNWSAADDNLAYLNVPILDHHAPHTHDLKQAISWIHNQVVNDRPVVVHCALGRGRSVLIMAAYLLASNLCDDLDEALHFINNTRGTAKLNSKQYRKLSEMAKAGVLKLPRSILLVVNPVSGGGAWQHHKKSITDKLQNKYHVITQLTSVDTSATQIVQKYQNTDLALIVACGGDGTVNEVAAQIINTNTTMAIIPLGTTNALAHVLFGLKSKLAPSGVACDAILQGTSVAIDTALCNNETVLLVAGLGFEQQMISQADRQNKNEDGQMAYIKAFAQAVDNNQSQRYSLSVNGGEVQHIEACSIVVANAAPFTTVLAQGGSEPNVKDGQLDMTIINTHKEIVIPILSLGLKSFIPDCLSNEAIEGVSYQKVESLVIEQTKEFAYVIDGENRRAQRLEIEVNPASLNIMHVS